MAEFSPSKSGFKAPSFASPAGAGRPMGGNPLEGVRDFINDYKIESLAILVVLGCLAGVYFVATERLGVMQRLDGEIKVLVDKDPVARDFTAAEKTTNDFIKSVPVFLPDKNFVVMLTHLADKRGVKIASFNPPKFQRQGFFGTSSVQLSFSAPSFLDAMLFLNDMENQPFSLRVMTITARVASVRGQQGDDAGGLFASRVPVDMNVVLSSLRLIENEDKTSKNK